MGQWTTKMMNLTGGAAALALLLAVGCGGDDPENGEPQEPAAKKLCTTTGGDWNDAAASCTCPEPASWDAATGCQAAEGDNAKLCTDTGGTWDEASTQCACPAGQTFAVAKGCAVDAGKTDAELCQDTGGAWSGGEKLCTCAGGDVWTEGKGCVTPLGDPAQKLCEDTEGTWDEATKACQCLDGSTWDDVAGCKAAEDLQKCLEACGDGCFQPEHKVCGEDGAWWCPCEMACHGVSKADDIFTCCEPVPSNCVPTCQENKAMNCTSSTDEYGCPVLEWTTKDCGDLECVADYDNDLAFCKAGSDKELCESTGGEWTEAGGVGCNCGPGGGWNDLTGCFGKDEALCVGTGGAWMDADCGPFCGTCECPPQTEWDAAVGCKAVGELAECLEACGDGCYKPEDEACGVDGKWYCPCEMACYGVAKAEDAMETCCTPVPPGCVPSCEGGFAKTCEVGKDAHGCTALKFDTMDCGGMLCVTSFEKNVALCINPCAPMEAELGLEPTDTAWGWKFDGEKCTYLGGASPCLGDACDYLYATEDACVAAHAVCITPPTLDELCTSTGGSLDEPGGCGCGPGGAFDPDFGCFPKEQLACVGTGGTWQPAWCGAFCGECTCPEGTSFDGALGCN